MANTLKTIQTFTLTRWIQNHKTQEQIRRFQEKQIIQHCRYLIKHSRYFYDFSDVKSLYDFFDWPTMDKEIMMDRFDEINTAGLSKDTALEIAITGEKTRNFSLTYNGYTVGLSSGTSGHRGLFVLSDYEQAIWAGKVLAKFLPKQKTIGHKVAFFLRANSRLYQSTHSKILDFRYFDLYDSMKSNIEKLQHYQPSILVAPPSVLVELAEHTKGAHLAIKPKKIIAVAEVLGDDTRDLLCETFKQELIYQAYQATEGFLAYTCERGSLHINDDTIFMEKQYLDETRFIPIITDFYRKTQPIVRYRLNDILISANKTCSCGSAFELIDRIEGREDDVFVFESTNGTKIRVFPDMISRCMLYVNGIHKYKVVQSQNILDIYVDRPTNDIHLNINQEFSLLADQLNFIMPETRLHQYKFDSHKKLKQVERAQ